MSVSDGLSSFAKMGSGYYTDKLRQHRPIAVGHVVTALGATSFGGDGGVASHLAGVRVAGRGVPTHPQSPPGRSGEQETYGKAFGFSGCWIYWAQSSDRRALSCCSGPQSAIRPYSPLPWFGLGAAALIAFLVKEQERAGAAHFLR
jgi:hypothetical protein